MSGRATKAERALRETIPGRSEFVRENATVLVRERDAALERMRKEIAKIDRVRRQMRNALASLYTPAKIAAVQIICMGGAEPCQPCKNRELLCIALKKAERAHHIPPRPPSNVGRAGSDGAE